MNLRLLLLPAGAIAAGTAWWFGRDRAKHGGAVTKPEARGRADAPNDLTRIKGIGPALAAKLNAQGVTRYEHIACMTPADIDRIEAALKFKGRMARDQWIEQATMLADGKVASHRERFLN